MDFSKLFLALLLGLLLRPGHSFIGNDIFRTADVRLFDLFCAGNAGELAEIADETKTHEQITKLGIIRSVAELFKSIRPGFEWPQPGSEFSSLSQLFQSFYGPCASPDRFLESVRSIVSSNLEQDGLPGIKDDPRVHFDAEAFGPGFSLVSARTNQINTAAGDGKYATARELIGQSLHSLQKFYAHSNWVEMGHDNAFNLDFTDLGPQAGNSTATCDPDQCGPESCSDNIVVGNFLTSGYFHFNDMPQNANKCGHGSRLDYNYDSLGGINKDTTNNCFSPHSHLHKDAARLAEQTTFEYLEEIRRTIGNSGYEALFQLSIGSALAIVLDTSGSMDPEIAAVKQEVLDIIDSSLVGGSTPSVYLLAPFESSTIFTKTSDPQEAKEAILNVGHVDGTGIENVFSALQTVISNAPDYTDILVFTDEPGDDGSLLDSVSALAQAKHCKIIVIWTVEDEDSTPPELSQVCVRTGGVLIRSSKTSVDDIVGLLAKSIESSKATFSHVTDLSASTTTIYIDNSVANPNHRISAKVTGSLLKSILTSPDNNIVVDMFNDDSILSSNLKIDLVYRGDGLLDFSFLPSIEGKWTFENEPVAGKTITLEVSGSCTFNFLTNYEVLELNTTHPYARGILGEPISTSTPYLHIELTAVDLAAISAIQNISLITPNGRVLHTYDTKLKGEPRDDFLVETDEYRVPTDSFYVRLEGYDSSGNVFQRLGKTLFTPASTSVEVTSTSAKIEAAPGETVSAIFIVRNFGAASKIHVTLSDDLNFFQSVIPREFFLDKGGEQLIEAMFTVDKSATIGDVSTIVVVAHSDYDGTKNSALSQLYVISDNVDTTPPRYEFTTIKLCPIEDSGYNTCHLNWWNFKANVWDEETGLRLANVVFDENVSHNGTDIEVEIDKFVFGTQDFVGVSVNASCCVREANISLIDVAGNSNRAPVVQDPLRECGKLVVVSVTADTVIVKWSCPCKDWSDNVDRYEFDLIASDGEASFVHVDRCQTCGEDCDDAIVGLRSCMGFDLNLEAIQATPGTDSEVFQTQSITTHERITVGPKSISTKIVDSTSLDVVWSPPALHKECVRNYRVCYRALPQDARSLARSSQKCETTPDIEDFKADVTYKLKNLEPCSKYRIAVTAITPLKNVSATVYTEGETGFEIPSVPRNFNAELADRDTVTVSWNRPLIGANCINRYVTTFTEYRAGGDTKISRFYYEPINDDRHRSSSGSRDEFEFYETIFGLKHCSNYNFTVYGETESTSSPVASTTSPTGPGITVGAPSDVQITGTTDTQADVAWFPPEENFNCVEHYRVNWTSRYDERDSGSKMTDNELVYKMRIEPLRPCTTYDVKVESITYNGIFGISPAENTRTRDVAPGAAVNLDTVEIYTDGFKVTWCPPIINPQCAFRWDWNTLEASRLFGGTKSTTSIGAIGDCQVVEERNLLCSTNYIFTVWAYSSDGQEGDKTTRVITTLPCP